MNVRWCLETDDRIGMVRDIVAAIAECSGDVEAMEVVSRYVYIRLRCLEQHINRLQETLQAVDGVRRVDTIDSLPFEADEQNLAKRVMNREGTDENALSFAGLIYKSEAMKAQVRVAKAVAPRDVPVLITGESGTGKELLARAIHDASLRNKHRFVAVNCAAIPETLLDSELFGYVEGAFTGAKRGGRLGLFEVADEGTLFLDEIGEMNPAVQAKLLRVLSESEVRRVGDSVSRKVNVRVLAATNRNLEHLIETGQFRADLFFRLNVIPIQLPPLRARKEDIVHLAKAFIHTMERRLERQFQLPPETQQALTNYTYPGNIRELQNMIERACYLAEDENLLPNLLMLDTVNEESGRKQARVEADSRGGAVGKEEQRQDEAKRAAKEREAEEQNAEQKQEADDDTQPVEVTTPTSQLDLRSRVHAYELQIIQHAVQRAGSVRKAAQALGVSHTTLLNKLHRRQP